MANTVTRSIKYNLIQLLREFYSYDINNVR